MVSRTSPASSMKTSRSSSSTGSSSAGGGSRLTGTFCAGGLIGCTGAAITSARDRAGASLASASAAGGASASASGNCTSGRSRSERSSSSRLEPSQADTSPSASGKATSSGSGSSASRTSSCSAEPSKGSSAGNGFEAFQRRVEGQRRLLQAQIQRLAGLRRLRQVIAEPHCSGSDQSRPPARRGPHIIASARRSRPERSISSRLKSSRLRAGAGVDCGWPPLDHLRQRRRHFGGIVQRQVRARSRDGSPASGATSPRVQLSSLANCGASSLAASAGAVSAGGCSAVSATSTTASGLRLGSRGLDGSGPGQARLGRGRRIRFQRIAEVRQAVLGDVEDQVALAGMVLAQALQVILDAGDGIGQGYPGSASPAPPCAPAAVPGYSGCRFPAGSRRAPAGSSPGRRGPGSAAPARGPGARGSTARR